MATNWLDLQAQIRSGAASFAKPVAALNCDTGSANNSDVNLNLPSLSDATAGVNSFLGDIQGEIDQFGSEVMGVLQDIGAWIPSGLQTGETSPEQAQASLIADITQQNTSTTAGGNIAITEGYNENTGQSFWQIRTSSGSGIRIDTDGSVITTTSKDPPDEPQSGRHEINALGGGKYKFGEYLAIEVNNDNKVLGSADGTGPVPSFSIVINNGNADIEVRSGDMRVGSSGNIVMNAGKSLELRGADIKLLAGGGAGTKPAGNKAASEEYAGLVDIRCGVYRNNAITKQEIEGAKYQKLSGEQTLYMEDPLGSFNIVSAGNMMIDVAGDMLEKIGGKKATEVMRAVVSGSIIPAAGIISAPAGYTIVNKTSIIPDPTSGDPDPTASPVLLIENDAAATGGMKVNVTRGDIIFSTKLGNIATGNEKSVIADITKPLIDKTISPALMKLKKPGMYFGSDASDVSVYGKASAVLAAGAFTPGTPPVKDSIVITPGTMKLTSTTMDLVAPSGIFLN